MAEDPRPASVHVLPPSAWKAGQVLPPPMKELETLKAHQEAAMASKNAPKTSSLLERDSNSPAAASQAGVRRVSMEGPAASSGVKASNSETQKPETENIASGKENDAVFPVPMGPALRYASSSSALSDISLPFPKLHHSTTYGSVFGPHEAMFLPGPPPFHYAVSRGQELIGAPMIGTPQYAYVPYPVHPCYPYPVPVSLQRQETPTSPGSLSMAASALLDLTPATGGANPTGAVARFPFAERSPNFKRHAPMTVPDDDKDAPSPEKKTKEPAPAAEANLPNANIAARSQRLFENVPLTTTACKCKSSRCLKLYCACFQTGTFCDELVCKCKNCQNTEAESVPRGARTRAIYEILHRRPNAFDARLKKKTGQGCACKKSRCLQKYCDCYAIGVACSSKCSCVSCSNNDPAEAAGSTERDPSKKPDQSDGGADGKTGDDTGKSEEKVATDISLGQA